MKKIFISILLCLIFCSKGFADSFYFKECKLSSAVSGDYIINLKKNLIEVNLRAIDGTTQSFTDKIQTIENLEVLGPVDSPIFRIKKMYRTRLLLRSKSEIFIQKKLVKFLDKMKISSKIKLTVDVDPINFT